MPRPRPARSARPRLTRPIRSGGAFALLWAIASPGAAGQETIASDRPGIGSGSTVIGESILQFEAGIARNGSPGSESHSVGQLFVRYGLSGLELELLMNSWVEAGEDVGPSNSGFEDIAVGAKLPLIENHETVRMSLQTLLTLPTGSDGLSAEESSLAVNGLFDASLSDRVGASVNLSLSGIGASSRMLWVTATPSLSLNDQVGVYGGVAFLETLSDVAVGPSGDLDTIWLEGGVTLLATSDLQLDVNGAWAEEVDSWFVGFGVATRFGG